MANNKFYGYTPDPSKEKDGNRLDRLNPYELKKGMDYELVNMGCYRLAESTVEEREKATEKVIKNLQEYGGYYSALITYETKYRNPVEGIKKPSFKSYLKEVEDNHMIEVDKTYSNDKMTEPKYKKEDYTTKFETGKMKDFKLKALKEAIKREIIKEAEKKKYSTQDDAPKGKGRASCCPCGDGTCTHRCCRSMPKEKFNEKAGCCACGDGTCTHACCGGAWPPSTPKGKSKENPFDTGTGPTNPNLNTPENMQACKAAGSSEKQCLQGFRTNKVPPGATRKAKSGFWCCLLDLKCCEGKPLEPWMRPSEGLNKNQPMSEAKRDKDVYDMDDAEPTKSQIKGIDKSIGDAKEALAQAIKKVKELGPDIKKLAKETNEKIKKNPAGKADYLKTYTTNPDVKAFIKLRKMLKSADLL